MRWWCSVQNTAWTWAWQPYVGVWLFISALGAGYFWQVRRYEPTLLDARRKIYFVSGLVLLWAALDWPLGPLGVSYLASVHMLQYLLVGVAAPALLLLGIPPEAFVRMRKNTRVLKTLEALTHPVAAFLLFNVVMTVTHWPSVVDVMMLSQVGSFALDMTWLAAGLVFWWSVIAPVPEWPRFSAMFKVAYLALNVVLVRPPFALLLFSKYPAYATYELAPPIGSIHVMDDQQLAGGLMKVGTAWIMAVGVAVVLYRWHKQREVQKPTGVSQATL